MCYRRAEDVLPEYVLHLVQKYVDGELVYIPRKGQKRSWGSDTGARESLKTRNTKIHLKYQQGITVDQIAEEFCLSKKSVQRIIRNCRE